MKHFVSVCLYTIIVLSSFTSSGDKPYKLKTVVIDAGHGGKDPGCHGKGSEEADITLKVALELGRIIKENLPDVKVIYTRNNDTFVELHDRAGIANKNKADLFISIHCNSGPSDVFGTETYTMGLHSSEENLQVAKRENAVIFQEKDYKKNYGGYNPNSPMGHILMANYQNALIKNSIRFAGKVEAQLKKRVGRSSRGVKQAGLVVLWKTTMPGALVEIGFLTNPKEEKYLNNDTNRSYIASAIYRAVKEYKSELESMN